MNNPQMEVPGDFNPNAIALRYGLMTGFIGMFLTTINNLYLLKFSYITFIISSLVVSSFLVPVTFYAITVKRQRNLLGGFISIKEAFRVVFIVVLISVAINSIYGVVYIKWIDPEYVERMKEATYAFMERQHVPQEAIDAKMNEFDEGMSKSMHPGRFLFSMATLIILQSIFGFLTAMVLKRDRPVAQTL
jgi:hypothetical protein